MTELDQLLRKVTKPARYAGGEWNSVVKDWDEAAVRIALVYPDIYDIGMSNLGLAILYELLNAQPDVLSERAYAPWNDMEAQLRSSRLPLFSLENRRPLGEFDVVGFSLGYELTYTNVLNVLDLSGLPIRSADRSEKHPLIIAGGTGALNPEPLAAFIDAFVVGDGEEVVLEMIDVLRRHKRGGGDRRSLLRKLATLRGVYVPSFYDVRYHDNGTVAAVEPLEPEVPHCIERRFVEPLPPTPVRPIVPFLQTVHDRAAVEIQRGCTQGCRFCQAGVIYRPRRERPASQVLDAAREALASTGHSEVALMSLSATDHSEIGYLVDSLRAEHGDNLAISLPSLRVDSFSIEVAAAAGAGKRNLTFAPEAGSQRLRDVINKTATEDDILKAADTAFRHGWTNLKLYFMLGLPTETLEDVQAIVDLASAIRNVGRGYLGGRAQLRVSTSNFIPKPHTPFQWAPQMGEEELGLRNDLLRRGLRRAGITFSWEGVEQALLEAVLARGDRRLGDVIERAWRAGARFDAWNDLFDWSRWQTALRESGLEASFYAHRTRDEFEVLPWSHIDTGVTAAFLRREWQRAIQAAPTPDCHASACNNCGLEKGRSASCQQKLAALVAAKHPQP